THTIAADRHMYLPFIGLLLVAAWGVSEIFRRTTHRKQTAWILSIALLGAAALEAHASRRYLAAWSDSETLYRYALRNAPDAPALHINLGLLLAETGRTQDAILEYRRVLELEPESPEAMVNLASALADEGADSKEVIALFQRALEIKPNNPEGHNNLAF